jgi:hypothetical protein
MNDRRMSHWLRQGAAASALALVAVWLTALPSGAAFNEQAKLTAAGRLLICAPRIGYAGVS